MTDGLACVVMSLRCEPGLVAAVRSLEQQRPDELVVVNSGGGDPRGVLRAAGLEVPLAERDERLMPGAARNLGIAATRSRYVAFLAADCVAEPGWVAARLRRHLAGAAAVASAVTNACPESSAAQASYLLLFHTRMPTAPPGARVLYGASYDRALFERYGLFSGDLRIGEDTEFHERFGGAVELEWAPEVRTAHRHAARPGPVLREHCSPSGILAAASSARRASARS